MDCTVEGWSSLHGGVEDGCRVGGADRGGGLGWL
jgi:hypothetical protein